jgi:predicted TIM-barrel fold metal-dependent hydrolase
MSHLLLSADTHLMEPPDLWVTRLPKAMRDRAVRLEYTDDVMHFYRAGGHQYLSISRYRDLDGAIDHDTDFESRRQALTADGVWGEVVHSNLAFNAFAHARVYNDYLFEVFGGHFDRHKPTAMLPLTDVDDAVAEVERVAAMGICAAMPPMNPPAPYCTSTYDRVWAAAQAHGMVVCFHIGAGMALDNTTLDWLTRTVMLMEAGVDIDDPTSSDVVHAHRLRGTIPTVIGGQEIIADLIGGGVLDRFSNLHFVFTEFNAYWLAGLMGALDKAYTVSIGQDVSAPYARFGAFDRNRPTGDQPLMAMRYQLNESWPYPLRPSEYIRRQIHCTFQDDPTALALREFTGIECLLWGSDYPHHEGTWPRTHEAVATQFSGIPESDAAAITGGTLAKLFGFPVPLNT